MQPQDAVGFLGCEHTLPAHVELLIHQYPQVPLLRAALEPLSAQPLLVFGIAESVIYPWPPKGCLCDLSFLNCGFDPWDEGLWAQGNPSDREDSMSYPHCFQSSCNNFHIFLWSSIPSASALKGCITGLLSVYVM